MSNKRNTKNAESAASNEPLSNAVVWIIFIVAMIITTIIIEINIPCILGILERGA